MEGTAMKTVAERASCHIFPLTYQTKFHQMAVGKPLESLSHSSR